MRIISNLIQEIERAKQEVEWALNMGDLRENVEYKQGNAKLNFLLNQYNEFWVYLNEVNIFVPRKTELIQPYSKVSLLDLNRKEIFLELVDRFNVNLELNKIYYKSPLGLTLLGKAKGDQVQLGKIIKVINLTS